MKPLILILLFTFSTLFSAAYAAKRPDQTITLHPEQIVSIEVGSRGHVCVFIPPGGDIQNTQFWFEKFGVNINYLDESNVEQKIRLDQNFRKRNAMNLAKHMKAIWKLADEQGKDLKLNVSKRKLTLVERAP